MSVWANIYGRATARGGQHFSLKKIIMNVCTCDEVVYSEKVTYDGAIQNVEFSFRFCLDGKDAHSCTEDICKTILKWYRYVDITSEVRWIN